MACPFEFLWPQPKEDDPVAMLAVMVSELLESSDDWEFADSTLYSTTYKHKGSGVLLSVREGHFRSFTVRVDTVSTSLGDNSKVRAALKGFRERRRKASNLRTLRTVTDRMNEWLNKADAP